MNTIELAKNHLLYGTGRLLVILPYTLYEISVKMREIYEEIPVTRYSLARGEIETANAIVMFRNESLTPCSIRGYRFDSVIVDECVSMERIMKEEILSRIVVPKRVTSSFVVKA